MSACLFCLEDPSLAFWTAFREKPSSEPWTILCFFVSGPFDTVAPPGLMFLLSVSLSLSLSLSLLSPSSLLSRSHYPLSLPFSLYACIVLRQVKKQDIELSRSHRRAVRPSALFRICPPVSDGFAVWTAPRSRHDNPLLNLVGTLSWCYSNCGLV